MQNQASVAIQTPIEMVFEYTTETLEEWSSPCCGERDH